MEKLSQKRGSVISDLKNRLGECRHELRGKNMNIFLEYYSTKSWKMHIGK
jgi:hypothetical protein